MASYKTHFGAYLKTEDLEGKAHRVVIERLSVEDVGGEGKKESKLVAHFAGKSKALVLNKTKCEALERITGTDEVEDWPGTTVVLRPGLTKFGGKTVGCIDIVSASSSKTLRPAPKPVIADPDPEPAMEDGEGLDDAGNDLDEVPF